jgi:GxxExxY protein
MTFDLEKYKNKMSEILSCCFEVHKTIGGGMSEAIYQECLCYEFQKHNIPFAKEKKLVTFYKDIQLEKEYKVDLVCYDDIIVELKSVSDILPEHRAQLFNYLRITKSPIGLLINFGIYGLQFEKYAYNKDTNIAFLLSRYGIDEE